MNISEVAMEICCHSFQAFTPLLVEQKGTDGKLMGFVFIMIIKSQVVWPYCRFALNIGI